MNEQSPQAPTKRISWPATILVGLFGTIAINAVDETQRPAPRGPLIRANAPPARVIPPDPRKLEEECPNSNRGEVQIVQSPLNYPANGVGTFTIMGSIGTEESGAAYQANAATEFLLANALDNFKQDVVITLNTGGGSIDTGHALMDAIDYYGEDKVSILCAGTAISEGSILLATGGKGKRFSTMHCNFATHSARSGIDNPDLINNPAEGLVSPELLTAMRAQLQLATEEARGLYQTSSGGLVDERCARYLTRDTLTFLTPQQTLRLGLVDYILANDGQAVTLKPAPTP